MSHTHVKTSSSFLVATYQRSIIYIALFLLAIWTSVMSLGVVLFFLWPSSIGHWIERTWSKGWCYLLGIRVRVLHPERLRDAPAMVLAPNHQSMFDILVLSTLPYEFRYLSKKQVRNIPFLGWALNVLGTYWVSRDHTGQDLNVMKAVEEGLRQGYSVMIFPEGTRSTTGKLLPFKKGAFRTALNAGVPICPIAVSGTFDIAPPRKLPYRRGHDVTVRIGQPFYPNPDMPLEDVMLEYRGVLEGLLENQ